MNQNLKTSAAITQELVRMGFPEKFFRVERRKDELVFTLADFLGECFIDILEEFQESFDFSGFRVKIRARGYDFYYPPVPRHQTVMNLNQTDKLIVTLNDLPVRGNYTDRDLELEALSSENSCTIIDMATGKGVFAAGDIIRSSGLSLDQWYKQPTNNNPSPPDFHSYIAAIADNARSNPNGTADIWYVAPQFTGEMFNRHLRVRLVQYKGKLCRLVKNLNMISLM